MRFNNILFYLKIVSFLFICSCQKKIDNKYSREDLNGHWAIDMNSENLKLKNVVLDSIHNVYPIRNFFEDINNGFHFFGDSCTIKPGFFDLKNRSNGLPLLVSFQSTFRIDNDTLKIMNESNKDCRKFFIKSLNRDTLILKDLKKNRLFKYIKVDKVSHGFDKYDIIVIVSITPDYLCDEIYYLDKGGNFLYQKFDIKKSDIINSSYHEFRLNEDQLKATIDNFSYVDINSLKEQYLSSKSDGKTVNFIFFINDDEIVKVIEDDDYVSPDELQWGYIPMMFFRRQVNMEILDTENGCYPCNKLNNVKFKIINEVKMGLGWDWDIINGNQKK